MFSGLHLSLSLTVVNVSYRNNFNDRSFLSLIGFPKASAKLLLYFEPAKLLQEIFKRFFVYFTQLADLHRISYLLKYVKYMLCNIKSVLAPQNCSARRCGVKSEIFAIEAEHQPQGVILEAGA